MNQIKCFHIFKILTVGADFFILAIGSSSESSDKESDSIAAVIIKREKLMLE